MKYDIFISYSSKDKNIADAIVHELEERGLRCWIAPRDIQPGKEYAAEIINAIKNSKIMVLVFSKNSNNSVHVLREVERAVSEGLPIIPFRIEDVFPTESMQYYISAAHWLDAFTLKTEEQIEKLYESIVALLKNSNSLPSSIKKWSYKSPKFITFATLFLVLFIAIYLIYNNLTAPKEINYQKILDNLIIYAKKGDVNKIDEILSDPNIKGSININSVGEMTTLNSLLHIAVERNNTKLINYLLKNGADINMINKNNQTPLQIAIKNQNLKIIEKLLKNGAKLNTFNKKIPSTLLVNKRNNNKILELLLKYQVVNPNQEINNKRPLTIAILNNNLDAIKILLKYGANPNYKNENGLTPLHLAVKNGNLEVTKILLRYGAKIDIKSKNGFTPIELAKEEKIKELLKKAKQQQQNQKNLELIKAVKNNKIEKVEKLLKDRNINVNFKDKNGNTLLIIAIKNHNNAIAKILLKQKNINVNIDKNLLQNIKDKELLDLIKKKQFLYTQKIIDLFAPYTKEFNINKIKYYVNLGGDLNSALKKEDILCQAVRSTIYRISKYKDNNLSNIKTLLDHNVKINVDCYNNTTSPLYFTIDFFEEKECYPKIATLLLRYGADVNYKSKKNYITPYLLMKAYRSKYWWKNNPKCKEIEKLFKKHNKKRNKKLTKKELILIQLEAINKTPMDEKAAKKELEKILNED